MENGPETGLFFFVAHLCLGRQNADMNPMESGPKPIIEESAEQSPQPETAEDLAALEERIIEIRKDLQLLDDVLKQHDVLRWDPKVIEQIDRAAKKVLGLIPKPSPRIPGWLSDDQRRNLFEAFEAIEKELHELRHRRHVLEETILDPDKLGALRKSRMSRTGLDNLRALGQFVTSEEQYQVDKGEAYWAAAIDRQTEELKQKKELK